MKQCPKCQAELNDDSLFCSKCGASVVSSPEPSSTETAAPAKKPVYKTFLFWVILISVAFFIAKGIVNVSYGMPMSDFTGDLTVIFALSLISLIPFAIIHTIVENTSPAKRKFARSFASVLYFLIFFVVASFIFIASTTMTYDPNYTEEAYFAEHYQSVSRSEVRERFEANGYTVKGFTASENWSYTVHDGEYKVIFLVGVEKGISGTQKYWCCLTYKFASEKDFRLIDIDIEPYLLD